MDSAVGRSKTLRARSWKLTTAGIGILVVASGWYAWRVATDGPGSTPLGFHHDTGLTWPSEARIIRRGDTHGNFFLVFQVDEATIRRWLSKSAPWGGPWRSGPVPGEIGYHTTFGFEPTSMKYYTNRDGELVRLLGSSHIWYAARERGSGQIRWHNGDLLIVDPRTRLVWLSVWDW